MGAKRYFEFSEGTSNKFWEVWCDGAEVFTRYGKIGAQGQQTVKNAGSIDAAKAMHDKLVREKTGKGYAEKKAKGNGAAKAKPAAKAAKPAKGAKLAKGTKEVPIVDEAAPVEVPNGAFRLELVEGTSSKFWQIHRDEKKLTITFGKIGTPGQVQIKKFKDEWQARREHDKQLAEKRKKGYELVLSGPRPKTPAVAAQNPQLDAAILKDPSSDDSYMVYADWLQEQGDVRGELASLQARLAKNPKDKKLANAETKLLWEHRAHFFGPLAVYLRATDRAVEATWRQGWIDSLVLGAIGSYSTHQGVPNVDSAGELIRLLPKVASARFLRELVISRPSGSEYHFGDSIAALVEVLPKLSALRRLTLGRFTYEDSELSWSHMGSVAKLWPVAKQLEYLKLRAGSMELGKIAAPELRELWIETGGLDKKNWKAILDGNLPKLETLNVWFGKESYGGNCKATDVAPILDGKKFPRLKHLGIKNTQWGNELAGLLPPAKILRQLDTLDISMSHLTKKGLAILVQHKDAFAHIKELDLHRCLLTKPDEKLAKTLAKSVKLDKQRDPNDYELDTPPGGDVDEDENAGYRYAAVGE